MGIFETAFGQVMLDNGLVEALFDYVRPNDSVCTVDWTSAQYEELQLQVGGAAPMSSGGWGQYSIASSSIASSLFR